MSRLWSFSLPLDSLDFHKLPKFAVFQFSVCCLSLYPCFSLNPFGFLIVERLCLNLSCNSDRWTDPLPRSNLHPLNQCLVVQEHNFTNCEVITRLTKNVLMSLLEVRPVPSSWHHHFPWKYYSSDPNTCKCFLILVVPHQLLFCTESSHANAALSSYNTFIFRVIFNHPVHSQACKDCLLCLWLASSATDYTNQFQILVAQNGWTKPSHLTTFHAGLHQEF